MVVGWGKCLAHAWWVGGTKIAGKWHQFRHGMSRDAWLTKPFGTHIPHMIKNMCLPGWAC